MTHREELRQKENELLNSIWKINHGPEVFNGAKRQMFAEQLRAVRAELAQMRGAYW